MRRVPFHASDVGGCGMRRAWLRVEACEVFFRCQIFWLGLFWCSGESSRFQGAGGAGWVLGVCSQLGLDSWLRGEWHDVQVVQEDPEDFFCDVYDFAVPDDVGAGLVHLFDPGERLFASFWSGIAEVVEDLFGALWEGRDVLCSGAEMHEEEVDDDRASRELGWTLVFGVEEHGYECWEERVRNLREL